MGRQAEGQLRDASKTHPPTPTSTSRTPVSNRRWTVRPLWFDAALTSIFVVVLLGFLVFLNACVLADKCAGQGIPTPVVF